MKWKNIKKKPPPELEEIFLYEKPTGRKSSAIIVDGEFLMNAYSPFLENPTHWKRIFESNR